MNAVMSIFLWICLGTNIVGVFSTYSDDCHQVKKLFENTFQGHSSNAPATAVQDQLEVCNNGGPTFCCTSNMEKTYVAKAKENFKQVLDDTSTYLNELVEQNKIYFHESFQNLLHLVENKTDSLFASAYGNEIPLKDRKPPIKSLFLDLRAYLNKKEVDIRSSVDRFFDELFPLVFHNILVNPRTVTELDDDYRDCLMEVREQLYPKPFGDIPGHLAHKLSRSMTVARLFLDSLNVASKTINSTREMNISITCAHALTRLQFCSHCQGYTLAKPCESFCHNVMQGCLASLTDIDRFWHDFLQALDLLISSMDGIFNFEKQLHGFHRQVSDAIMHAMQTGPKFYKQVIDTSKCGPLKTATEPTSQPLVSTFVEVLQNNETNHLIPEIQNFVKKLRSSKQFFLNLTETMCSTEKIQVKKNDHHCWNGKQLAKYTFPVVGKEYETQVRENPEVQVAARRDPYILDITNSLATTKKVSVMFEQK